MTPQRKPFISMADRDLARQAARAQKVTYRITSLPVLVSIASAVIAASSALYSNVGARAEQMRLLDADMRDAIPVIAQYQSARHLPADLNLFPNIQRKLNSPFASLLVWQSDIAAMRMGVAWEKKLDEMSLQDDKVAEQLRQAIAVAERREKSKASRTSPTASPARADRRYHTSTS